MRVAEIKPILCHGGVRAWTFVKVTTDNGITGWGDASEWARAPAHCRIIEEDLAPLVIGESPFDIERLWQKMWAVAYVGGKDLSVAMTGIETALWDIVGKALGTPAYNLLGGRCRDRLRLYYDTCDAFGEGFGGGRVWQDGDASPEGIARQAEHIRSLGFDALKLHPIGLSRKPGSTRVASLKAISDTAAKVRLVREVVGEGMDIAIDLNNKLDLPSSIALARALEPYRLMFFEDPIRQDESAGSYRRLVESTSTPIGTGENLYTVWDFRNYLEIGALDVLLPDVCHTGVLQAKKIAAMGEAFHLPIAPHNPNSPLSTMISAAVCATMPNLLALEYYSAEREPPWVDTVMSPPLSSLIEDGHLRLPSGPGWGVEINEGVVAEHPYEEVWSKTLTSGGKRGLVLK